MFIKLPSHSELNGNGMYRGHTISLVSCDQTAFFLLFWGREKRWAGYIQHPMAESHNFAYIPLSYIELLMNEATLEFITI